MKGNKITKRETVKNVNLQRNFFVKIFILLALIKKIINKIIKKLIK